MKAPPIDPVATVTAMLDADPDVMDRDELAAATRQVAALRTWLDARQVRITRRNRVLAEQGHAENPKDFLIGQAGQSGRDAHTASERERICTSIPAIDDALANGDVAAAHVDAIAQATKNLDATEAAEFASFAGDLIGRADHISVDAFGKEARQLAAFIASQSAKSDAEELERQRRASKVSRWVDKETGMCHTKISLDPVRDAEFHRGLQRHIKRTRSQPGGDRLTFDQLQAHAVVDAITGGANDGSAKVVQLIVVIDEQTLRDGLHEKGICETSDGTPIPVSLVRQMACEAEIIPVVLNGDGVAVDVGRASRLATEAQRHANRAMYATCIFPGCTVPFDECEMHHIEWWENGGLTNLGNLAPVCLANGHHHLIHDQGWTLTIDPDTRWITIARPDGTLHHQGPSLNRRNPAA